MFEWSAILYHLFDMQALHDQERAAGFEHGVDHPDDIPDDPALQPIRDFHRCTGWHRQHARANTHADLCEFIDYLALENTCVRSLCIGRPMGHTRKVKPVLGRYRNSGRISPCHRYDPRRDCSRPYLGGPWAARS